MFGVFRVKNHDFTPKKSYFALPPPPGSAPEECGLCWFFHIHKYVKSCQIGPIIVHVQFGMLFFIIFFFFYYSYFHMVMCN